ncbi:MAG: single-stranded-DNA-specific exonuclease RecJ, single-stranded-DNA-specific exonuclease [Candidatus Peregrinibacteria bacterium GW2011_GWF2_33_10]|nr:MAG: single-stranded-DNA-specific exonuclease RecJ, single-stranded-DNA-specific exonuclease [Candidatus Peregrinibacteria bacterium GW2011_GWF2_33_10]
MLDENGKAEKFVNKLEQLNSQRQQITDKALKYLEANFEDVLKNEDICILNHKDWPSGIIGLLAGKISEKYGKPAFIMEDRGGILIGSVRCPEYFDAFEAITHTKQYLEHFGGHQQAAGYSIKKENLAQFTQALKTFAKEKIAGKDTNPILEIDTIIDAKNLNLETVALINTFAPYGVGNKKPMFILENVNLQNLKKVGSEGKHLSLNTVCQNQVIKSIAFSFGQFFEKITSDKHYNIVCHLSSNKWNNYEKLELQIIDLT